MMSEPLLQEKKEWKDLSLEALQAQLARVEAERARTPEGTEAFDALEDAACLLRDLERKKVAELEKGMATQAGLNLQELKALSARIRERVTKMGKAAKGLDKVDAVLKELLKLLAQLL